MTWLRSIPCPRWFGSGKGRVHRGDHRRHGRRRLGRAISGRGAFGRFKDELYEQYPGLVPVRQAFRDARAERRAVEWLLEQGLIDEDTGGRYLRQHQDADLP